MLLDGSYDIFTSHDRKITEFEDTEFEHGAFSWMNKKLYMFPELKIFSKISLKIL